MDNVTGPPRSLSPTGSDASTVSNLSRKRERTNDGDGDDLTLPSKRNNRQKKLTLEAVMDKLGDMSTTMSRQSQLLTDLPIIRTTIDTVNAEVASLKATTSQLSTTTSALLTQTQNLASENAELKQSVAALEARVNQLSLAGNANALSHQRAQPSPNIELTVSGLSFGQVDSAVLLQYTMFIARALKVEIQPDDFTSARLLRKIVPSTANTVQEGTSAAPLVPAKVTYAVVCRSPAIVNRILAAKRTFGPLKFSQLDASAMMRADLAVFQPGDPFINLNELLPLHVLHLLNEAKTRLKAAGFKHVWARNSTVFAKFSNNALVQIINSPADIPRIIQLYSCPSPNHQ